MNSSNNWNTCNWEILFWTVEAHISLFPLNTALGINNNKRETLQILYFVILSHNHFSDCYSLP